jgi:nitroimidazol reductase NimA-like FMN-containing flavoprotein (pyridoxamine 5'-phosphate oxidase superfamily)
MPVDRYGIEMSEAELTDFLTQRGHGVLSFGGDIPYGIPVSFGYDRSGLGLVLQLLVHPGSEKGAKLRSTSAASLTTYEWTAVDDWRSVTADGFLEEIEPETPAAVEAAAVFADQGTVVGTEVFNRPLAELDAHWYGMDIDRLRGIAPPLAPEVALSASSRD